MGTLAGPSQILQREVVCVRAKGDLGAEEPQALGFSLPQETARLILFCPHSCLLSVPSVLMPQGQKRKLQRGRKDPRV